MKEKDANLLIVKNMVCDRCISSVKNIFEDADIPTLRVELGEIETTEAPTADQLELLKNSLSEAGFELLEDRQTKLINQVKKLIVEQVHYHEQPAEGFKLGKFLTQKLPHSYSYVSQLFSDVEGITIEKFYILQKIERVKELIFYDELSLSEIADITGYSSVQHLSTQFKNVTGMSPSAFKKNKPFDRKPLDKL